MVIKQGTEPLGETMVNSRYYVHIRLVFVKQGVEPLDRTHPSESSNVLYPVNDLFVCIAGTDAYLHLTRLCSVLEPLP